GHAGRKDARDAESRFGRRRRKLTKCSATFGTRRREGCESAGSAEMGKFHTGKVGTKGTQKTRIAEKPKSQSDHATCHRQKRDKEAHFGWIG
ncbi:hypothetical protein KI387_041403, partial [Taxus chinensis]